MPTEPEQIYVERIIEVLTDANIVGWACDALLGSFAGDELVCEIASLNPSDRYELERAVAILGQLIERRGFVVNSPPGVAFAQSALRRTCERYLAGEIRPYELSRLVSPIEQLFAFPPWLGNLYNACDWIETETEHAAVPDLKEEVAVVLAGLRNGD